MSFGSMAKKCPRDPSARFESLDGLRFVAALGVLLFHLGFRVWNSTVPGIVEYPLLGHVAKYGYLGVDLFFMISGFVILMTASRGGAGAFLLSRIVRLYPAYWFCVATTFAFLALWRWGTSGALPLEHLLINLTMLQATFGVPHVDPTYWTLAVELHFYALILLVLWAGQLAHIDRILALWLFAGIAADFVPGIDAVGQFLAAPWCQYFVAGALAYRMWQSGFSAFRLLFYGLAFAQAARHAHWYMHLKQRLTGVPYEPWVVQGLIALLFGLFLLLALGWLRPRHSSLRALGALTYPLYLIHGVIGTTLLLAWVRDYGGNRWIALGVVTAVLFATAWIIQRYVEVPLAPRLRRFLKPLLGSRPAGAKG